MKLPAGGGRARKISWWDLGRCAMVAALLAAGVKWGQEDFQELAMTLAVAVVKNPLWAIGLTVLAVVALSSRWLRHWWRVAWQWSGPSDLTRVPLVLMVGSYSLMLAFAGPDWPWIAYVVLGTVLWFLLAYLTAPAEEGRVPESVKDALNRRYFVDRIAELFAMKRPTVRRIAILGAWGSGKSMILRLLRERFEKDGDGAGEGKWRIATVNPWKARTPAEAWAILAGGFDQALDLPEIIPASWTRLPMVSWLASLLPGVGADVLKLFSNEGASKEALLEKVNRSLRAEPGRLLMMVEDMERAEPEVLRSLFQVIDQLGDFQDCFFVFAIDPQKVAEAFEETWPDGENTRGFMNKVFDLKIPLPDPRQEDVAAMIGAKAADGTTPKLAKAFDSLAELIPVNPRAALQFYEDAKARELLFLERFVSTEERDPVAFFTGLLAEHEFPELVKAILGRRDLREKYEAAPSLQIAMGDKGSEDVLRNLIAALPATLNRDLVGTPREHRLETMMQALVNRVKLADLEWLAQGYDKLLDLSQSELGRLDEQWQAHAGKKPVSEMLRDGLPNLDYCNPAACVRQLIAYQVQLVKDCAFEVKREQGEVRSVLIDEALKRIAWLAAHFHFSRQGRGEQDASVFDARLESSWWGFAAEVSLDLIDSHQEKCLELHLALSDFNILLVDVLPLDACYRKGRGLAKSAAGEVQNYRMAGALGGTKFPAYGERLGRAIYEKRITPLFMEHFRSGKLEERLYPEGITEAPEISLYYDPDSWLWPVEGDFTRSLLTLTLEARDPGFAKSSAWILSNLLLSPFRKEESLFSLKQRDHVEFLIEKCPHYLRFFWESALSLEDRDEVKLSMLKLRRELFLQRQSDPEIIKMIQENFPLEGEPSPLPGIILLKHPGDDVEPKYSAQ